MQEKQVAQARQGNNPGLFNDSEGVSGILFSIFISFFFQINKKNYVFLGFICSWILQYSCDRRFGVQRLTKSNKFSEKQNLYS